MHHLIIYFSTYMYIVDENNLNNNIAVCHILPKLRINCDFIFGGFDCSKVYKRLWFNRFCGYSNPNEWEIEWSKI